MLVYGRSVAAIADDGLVQMSPREAQRIQTLFFERMPRVVAWIQEVQDFVQTYHWVESPLGRKRRFPIIPGDRSGEMEVYRQAVNMIPQSMASDITTSAFIKLDRAGLHPLISVHDSILCEVPESDEDSALAQMVEIMETTGTELYGAKIPFKVEGSKGKKWSEL